MAGRSVPRDVPVREGKALTDIEHIAASLTAHEKWGQLAEEASELSQAALKMQRLFMPMNKPRKTYRIRMAAEARREGAH